MNDRLTIISVSFWMALSSSAQAQFSIPTYPAWQPLERFQFNWSDRANRAALENNIIRERLESNTTDGGQTPSPSAQNTTFVAAAGADLMPAKLAASYPAAQRPQVEKTFREILGGYKQLESKLGIPKHDLAGAIAAFIAGNWMAYRDQDLPDANFLSLVSQIRAILNSNPDLAQASNAEKQEMYEQMAILGTLMALTRDALRQQPNPQLSAKMRTAAKGYLESFLKTDADRVNLTAQGLELR